jgi:hypothetical protein
MNTKKRSLSKVAALPLFSVALAAAAVSFVPGGTAHADEIHPAVYVLVDTSGSMLETTAGVETYGDGSLEHPHEGGLESRLYMAKEALSTVINAYGEVRWGLARFSQNYGENYFCMCHDQQDDCTANACSAVPGGGLCYERNFDDSAYTCEQCDMEAPYPDYDLPGVDDRVCINYAGGVYAGCTDPHNADVLDGADILVALADDNEERILMWIDHHEDLFYDGLETATDDHCFSGSTLGDCELRAVGGTPIGGSLADLYSRISNTDLPGDTLKGCRPYSIIVLTDGANSCPTNPTTWAGNLRDTPDVASSCTTNDDCPLNSVCGAGNKCTYDVKTYVIGFALSPVQFHQASQIAYTGGTGSAIPAWNAAEIASAMADIVADSIVYELCNDVDDDCDGSTDEDFPLGQICNNGLPGICYAEGVYECDPTDETAVTCVVDPASPTPGEYEESCNGLDDDCDGQIDEEGVCTCNGPELCNGFDDYCGTDNPDIPEGAEDDRVGQSCGSDVGQCTSGLTYCWVDPADPSNVEIRCNGVTPTAEVCDPDVEQNDQNCNGVNNDGVAPQPCQNSNGYGTCDGMQTCAEDGTWTCWAKEPAPESCNGVDDNCDGQTDEGLGQTTCGLGVCRHTVDNCVGGVVQNCDPYQGADTESCDGLDNDCDGVTDGLSEACYPANTEGCTETAPGVFDCVGICAAGTNSCPPGGSGGWSGCQNAVIPQAEICDGLDNDCDGQTDENATNSGPLAESCYTGPNGTDDVGLCVSGQRVCSGGSWGTCSGEITPVQEVCDNQDNDCDGQTDEELGETTCGLGICQHTVQNCVGGVTQTCDPYQGAGVEICDGLDNDCNGVADGLMRTCYDPTAGCVQLPDDSWDCQGVCAPGIQMCAVDSGTWSDCQYDVGPSTESCDNQDNDCDGQTDEDDAGNPLSSSCYPPGSGLNTGCTHDASTLTWSCQGQCAAGQRVCSQGVWGTCSGHHTPQQETCNALDDDCDGQTDEPGDIAGLNQPCGTALGRCTPGIMLCVDGQEICDGGEGPYEGECNGQDDDCDGEIDEPDEVADEEGAPCGSDVGACETGETRCLGGEITCEGGVEPTEEVCDGVDNDCDGETDNGAQCPPDYYCVLGDCRKVCDPGDEFSCPGSLSCEAVEVDGETVHVCLPSGGDCGGETCPEGWICVNDECVDPCADVECEDWQECNQGVCVDVSCSSIHYDCPSGEFCVNHQCVSDPCLEADCDPQSEFCIRDCDETNCTYHCEPLCLCANGERCTAQGTCELDPCADVACDSGQRCNPENGQCEEDPCYWVNCDGGETCLDGACVPDPCATAECPDFFDCVTVTTTDGTGGTQLEAQCVADTSYWVDGVQGNKMLATGTGGCNCRATRGNTLKQAVSHVGWLLLALLGLTILCVRRRWRARAVSARQRPAEAGSALRRRSRVGSACGRKSGLQTTLFFLFSMLCALLTLSGCELDPYQSGSNGHWAFPDGGETDSGPDIDAAPDACVAEPEVCDEQDNDCDGETDEDFDLQTDAYNCGECGRVCEFAHALAECVQGSCVMTQCLPGHWDLNDDPTDGCEYACHETNNGQEVCDGVDNDCDGAADEGFDLQNDPQNCGQCHRECAFFKGVGACVSGECTLEACVGGYVDKDGDPDNGCECMLDISESTVECDPADPVECGAGEVCADQNDDTVFHCALIPADGCDGVDNDCDGDVDEDAPTQLAGTDCYTHPVGCTCTETAPGVFDCTCAGECSAGVPTCVGGEVVCGGQQGPAAEVCDDLDNDCNGQTDEIFDKQNDPANCGGCGVQCATVVENAISGCSGGACEVVACLPGYWDDNEDPNDGCEYACDLSNGGVEACGDNVDNDCNGETDEGFDYQSDPANCGACGNDCHDGKPFGTTVSGCQTGNCVYACLADYHDLNNDLAQGKNGNGCEYSCAETNNGNEACDGVDNDCDGDTDEAFNTDSDPQNCGSCGYICSAHVGAHSVVSGCANGVCVFSCALGHHDLNGDVSLGDDGNGCEYSCTATVPDTEVCDGADNDCDGQTDADSGGAPLTRSCYTGDAGTENVGPCHGGTEICDGSGGWSDCQGEVTPQTELCDTVDNDCDGQTDEDFDLNTDLNNCGGCQISCWAAPPANAYPDGCIGGNCHYACEVGYGDLNGDLNDPVTNGCEYPCPVSPPAEEYCDGLDNDCDGQTDEGLTAPTDYCNTGTDGPGPEPAGSPQNNPCHGVTASCEDPDGAGPLAHDWYCNYSSAVETDPNNPNLLLGYENLCNGYDGDCDGYPDDGFGLGDECDNGAQGSCRVTGTVICDGTDPTQTECDLPDPSTWPDPSDETCDGADNDCDGLTDENEHQNDPAQDPPSISQGYVVDDVRTVYPPSGIETYVYTYEASRPTATGASAGTGSNARACSRFNVIPWANVTYAQAALACARAGMRLCEPAEWYEACNGDGTTRTYPYGDTYISDACNGHDQDPTQDAVEPTGAQADCASHNYTIEDMSGNLREWTQNVMGYTNDGKSIYTVRGGSYNEQSGGLTCDFVSTGFVEDSLAPNVGFRCCTTCGNGTIDPGETCDPGVDPTNCNPVHCGPLTCGDGNLDSGEQCDDGNLLPLDGCSPQCRYEGENCSVLYPGDEDNDGVANCNDSDCDNTWCAHDVQDNDEDGFSENDGDCDDDDDTIHPAAAEICDDNIDNNCNGDTDNDEPDKDGDQALRCVGNAPFDCDDWDPDRSPQHLEIPSDGIDNDCDTTIDEALDPCDACTGAHTFADSMEMCGWWRVSQQIEPNSDSDGYGWRSLLASSNIGPNAGCSFMVLSSGDIDADTGGEVQWGIDIGNGLRSDPIEGPSNPYTVNDQVQLHIVLDVPTNVYSFSFDFVFFSAEYPEYVCTAFNDKFYAVIQSGHADYSGYTCDGVVPASPEPGQGCRNISFDGSGNRISVNAAFFENPENPANWSYYLGPNLPGTGYDAYDSNADDCWGAASGCTPPTYNCPDRVGGSTAWLTTTANVVPGERIRLIFDIHDESDSWFDSRVLIDNFRWNFSAVSGPVTTK